MKRRQTDREKSQDVSQNELLKGAHSVEWLLLFGLAAIPIFCTTFILDQFWESKWILIQIISTCVLASLVLQKKILIPFSRNLFYWVIGLFICLLVTIPGQPTVFLKNQVLDIFCFIALVFASFQISNVVRFQKRMHQVFLVVTALVLIYGGIQAAGFEPFKKLIHPAIPSNFFGFPNLAAEFVGASLLVQIFCGLSEFRSEETTRKILKVILLAASFAYLFLLSSRAALGGFGFALIVSAGFIPKRIWLRILSFGLLGTVLVVAAITFSPRFQMHLFSADGLFIKSANTSIRVARWKNTLQLISENPRGLGPGNYEFGYIPYGAAVTQDPEQVEGYVVKSPHNGYLEAIAEWGWVGGAIILFGVGWLLFNILRRRRELQQYSLFIALILFFAFDALFAFPMEAPWPFFLIAISVGLLLQGLGFPAKSIGGRTKWFLVPVITYCAIWTGIRLQARLVEASDEMGAARSCEIDRSNWRACFRMLQVELKNLELERLEIDATEVLKAYPNYYSALMFRAHGRERNGKIKEFCEDLAAYDKIFNHKSTYHESLKQYCPFIK